MRRQSGVILGIFNQAAPWTCRVSYFLLEQVCSKFCISMLAVLCNDYTLTCNLSKPTLPTIRHLRHGYMFGSILIKCRMRSHRIVGIVFFLCFFTSIQPYLISTWTEHIYPISTWTNCLSCIILLILSAYDCWLKETLSDIPHCDRASIGKDLQAVFATLYGK